MSQAIQDPLMPWVCVMISLSPMPLPARSKAAWWCAWEKCCHWSKASLSAAQRLSQPLDFSGNDFLDQMEESRRRRYTNNTSELELDQTVHQNKWTRKSTQTKDHSKIQTQCFVLVHSRSKQAWKEGGERKKKLTMLNRTLNGREEEEEAHQQQKWTRARQKE